MNIDMVQAAGITIRRNPSGKWFAGLEQYSEAGCWADTPAEAWAAFPDTLDWRVRYLEDRIARGEYYPEEPAELAWLRTVTSGE
jgi:hypothetical protein